jgi:methionyl aminopeptidase
MDDWEKAGKIGAEAREYAVELCKIGKTYAFIADSVEDFIIKKGGFPAFPMDVSVNNMAAHYCPFIDDKGILEKGDVVKLDIGVHVNGYVVDNATTVEVGSDKYKDLIKCCKEACVAGCEQALPDVEVKNIGKVIAQTIKDAGFTHISNLSGHGVGRWEVHCAPTIPNFDNGNDAKLIEGQHIAIEPFSTTGIGQVKEGKMSGVYQFVEKKPVRLDGARKLMIKIEKEYKSLPFTERWLKDVPNVKFLLGLLEKSGVIEQYKQLPEKSGGVVAQQENTICIGKGVITKI